MTSQSSSGLSTIPAGKVPVFSLAAAFLNKNVAPVTFVTPIEEDNSFNLPPHSFCSDLPPSPGRSLSPSFTSVRPTTTRGSFLYNNDSPQQQQQQQPQSFLSRYCGDGIVTHKFVLPYTVPTYADCGDLVDRARSPRDQNAQVVQPVRRSGDEETVARSPPASAADRGPSTSSGPSSPTASVDHVPSPPSTASVDHVPSPPPAFCRSCGARSTGTKFCTTCGSLIT